MRAWDLRDDVSGRCWRSKGGVYKRKYVVSDVVTGETMKKLAIRFSNKKYKVIVGFNGLEYIAVKSFRVSEGRVRLPGSVHVVVIEPVD